MDDPKEITPLPPPTGPEEGSSPTRNDDATKQLSDLGGVSGKHPAAKDLNQSIKPSRRFTPPPKVGLS